MQNFFSTILISFNYFCRLPRPFAVDCVTRERCVPLNIKKLSNDTWFVFNNTCLNECPENYERVSEAEGYCKYCGNPCPYYCNSTTIEKVESIFSLRNCTHINGSISIRMETSHELETKFLKKYFGKIQEISGYLEVYRTNGIKNLNFFENLHIIHGNDSRFQDKTFVLSGNAELETLWDIANFTLEIKRGGFLFQDNPQLCISEIDKFNKTVTMSNYDTTYSIFNNGEQRACGKPFPLNPKVIDYQSTNVTLKWDDWKINGTNNYETLIGYMVYYMESWNKNVTTYADRTSCADSGYETILVGVNNDTNSNNNTVMIKNLKPYTQYAYYIKILTNQNISTTKADNKRTAIMYFKTLSGDPSIPYDAEAIALNSEVIRVTWKHPKSLNGELARYKITVYTESENLSFIDQRNYCYNPNDPSRDKKLIQDTHKKHEEDENNENKKNGTIYSKKCCSNNNENDNNNEEEILFKLDFDDLCSTLSNSSCKLYEYESDSISSRSLINYEEYNVSADAVEYNITGLAHYTMYTIYLTACNHNRTEESQCSEYVMFYVRTLKKDNADDVANSFSVTVKDNVVYLKWSEPEKPNSLITSYNIEHRKADVENSKSTVECITRMEHKRSNHVYKIKNLLPGKYEVRVIGMSLAGPGRSTKFEEFVINSASLTTNIIIIVLSFFFICIITGGALYIYFKRKRAKDNLQLIANINPDYEGTVYIEDKWEITRSDVQVTTELGQGSFGMVYNGYIISKNIPCAIKTVNDGANTHERMEFLNEASVMKTFNDAYHVVKLLGVVSRGQPPLVVMELMARGDLKSFLRKSRDSSNNITCTEMYRMAAEIADGMYYLSAKKFIHRDLAARNCMVAQDHTVKIGDFGMARDIYETDYYRKETKGLLPVRWMAPESLADGVFTSDSDVWSYGIVLWEMVTLAEQPYQGLANEQVLQFVISRGSLTRPNECPDKLWEIMHICWKWKPIKRPTFRDIVATLESHVGSSFKAVSFFHSRAGEEHRLNAGERVSNTPAQSTVPEHQHGAHWNVSDEDDVSLYSKSNRPSKYLSLPYQRQNRLSSNYNLDDSPNYGFD